MKQYTLCAVRIYANSMGGGIVYSHQRPRNDPKICVMVDGNRLTTNVRFYRANRWQSSGHAAKIVHPIQETDDPCRPPEKCTRCNEQRVNDDRPIALTTQVIVCNDQSRMVVSSEHDSNIDLSGENAHRYMGPLWPRNVRTDSAVRSSIMRTSTSSIYGC